MCYLSSRLLFGFLIILLLHKSTNPNQLVSSLQMFRTLSCFTNDLNLIDLYLHVILCHFSTFFFIDKYSFETIFTEHLEYLFVTVKWGKYCTNRTKENVIKTTFSRFETQFLRELFDSRKIKKKFWKHWN